MSKLDELKNALKMLEQAEVGETLLESVRAEIGKAEELETADKEVEAFRKWKLEVVDGRGHTISPWYMLQESSRDSWRDAYRHYSEYFGAKVPQFDDLYFINESAATASPYFEILTGGHSDAEGFEFHTDLSFGFTVENRAYTFQFSESEFESFVEYINWLKAGAKGA